MIRIFDLPKRFWTDPKRAWACRKAMKEGVEQHPFCQTCGRARTLTQPIVAHHIIPFHIRPDLAADKSNFTYHHHPDCHRIDGHGGDFKHYVENVEFIIGKRVVHEEVTR